MFLELLTKDMDQVNGPSCCAWFEYAHVNTVYMVIIFVGGRVYSVRDGLPFSHVVFTLFIPLLPTRCMG